MNKIKYLLLIAMCLCLSSVAAQDRISGHVWNRTDGPVMMANVVELDQNNRIVEATTTDINGNFSMPIKNRKDRLQISYVGYQTHTQVIGDSKVFRIEMRSRTQLKGVTVKAQQRVKTNGLTIPAKEVSVATQTLNMDEMKGLSFETADQALQGQIAGLDIVMNSGNLGSGTTMRLRGVTTINGDQEPLIVVDGNVLDNYNTTDIDLQDMDNSEQFARLLSVNPEDIQSIDVLKDAAATAIWGSRGANGVIEIKTRRGRRGKTRIDFSYRFTGSWQPKGMKMLNGDEYTMMLKEAYFNPAQSSVASDIVEISYDDSRPMYFRNFNNNTEWRDEVTQFGQTHNYNLVLNGGGEKATYRISSNYDHETGTIIEQQLDRFSTRMALDYYVSDRIKFSSNFSLTYTNNKKNYVESLLDKAYNAMPNMSVYNYNYDPINQRYYRTNEYMKMFPAAGAAGPVQDGQSSYYLRDMVSNGNPVAIGRLSWYRESTYAIDPQFQIEYKLLGKDETSTQLNYNGEVYMYAFTNTQKGYYPASLTSNSWDVDGGINLTSDSESKNLKFNTKHTLIFTPKFSNEDHYFTGLARWEMETTNSNSQYLKSSGVVGGVTDPSVEAYLRDANTSLGKSHRMSALGSFHYSYKGKYVLDFTLRADGSTKFGKNNRWGFFPGVSGRWNISDEPFMKPISKYVSMLAFRPSWGIVGGEPNAEGLIYNKYSNTGNYGGGTAIAPSNLRLTDLKWERTSSWNLGFNLGLFEDLLSFELNVYHKYTKDLLMQNVSIPSSTGFNSLAWGNVGNMENEGWELNFTTKRIKITPDLQVLGKFNIAQNINQITKMDASVLSSLNGDFNYDNENYMSRVQIGNALGGIYGFRYKGVYRFDYDHCGYFADAKKNDIYAGNTAAWAEKYGVNGSYNATCPVARDANGNIIYDAKGNPLQMYYNYGGRNYKFEGGDVIYEDINHDGQINELDMVYLGSSNPKLNGGFGFDIYYKRWSLKTSFNFRVGNKIVNMARMKAEDMRTNRNQSTATRWRWRKNGDITTIPRAMSAEVGASYNALCSDRYVEPGDYVRFQYVQLAYDFAPEKLKRLGLRSLRLALSGNNLIFWSKYSGVDPEHSQSGWSPCMDNSQTPRSRSFTFSLNIGF